MAPFEHKKKLEKGVSNVGSHSFQPFDLPLQMPMCYVLFVTLRSLKPWHLLLHFWYYRKALDE